MMLLISLLQEPTYTAAAAHVSNKAVFGSSGWPTVCLFVMIAPARCTCVYGAPVCTWQPSDLLACSCPAAPAPQHQR
jgi:hypothetical protein